MEGVEDRSNDQILRPDHRRWPDQEPATDTRKTETDRLGSEDEKDTEARWTRIVVEHGRILDDDHVQRVGLTDGDVGHDGNERVFFDVERAWVERKLEAA